MSAHTYRMGPQWRRTAIITMVGFALLAVTTYWICYCFLERDWFPTVCCCCVFGAVSACQLHPLLWSIRVDGVGIARRGPLVWDDWTWSDFASGRIVKSGGFTFYDPRRPWTSCYLFLDFLADADRQELIQRINAHYRLPDPPVLPEALNFGFGFRRRLEILRSGLRVTVGGEMRSHGWQEVQRLRITRADPVRRDWVRIILWLPGREIELGGKEHGIHGATQEELNQFLVRHVPAERIDEDIWGECPHRVEDVQRELDKMDAMDRQARICLWLCGVGVAGCLAFAAYDTGVIEAILMAGLFGSFGLIFLAPVWWLGKRGRRQQRMQLQSWRSEIQARRRSQI